MRGWSIIRVSWLQSGDSSTSTSIVSSDSEIGIPKCHLLFVVNRHRMFVLVEEWSRSECTSRVR